MNLSINKDKPIPKQASNTKRNTLRHSSKLIILLILLVSLVVIIATAIGTAKSIVDEHAQALNRRVQLNEDVAKSAEQQINNVLQKAEQVTSFIAYMYIHHSHNDDLQSWLDYDLLLDNSFEIIKLFDAQGRLIASSGDDNLNNYNENPVFQQRLKLQKHDGLLIGQLEFDEQSNRWLLPFYQRINDAAGDFAGLVVLDINPIVFSNFFKDMDMPSAFIELAGFDGSVRSRVMSEKLILDGKNRSWNTRLISGQTGSYIDSGKNIDGINRIVAYRKLNDYDLVLTVGTSYDEAMSLTEISKKSKIFNTALIDLLVVIFAGLLIYLIRRQDKAMQTTQSNEALSVVRKSNGMPDFLVSAIQDITARKNLEEQLSYAASHDLLTELPNRLLLQRKLGVAISDAKDSNHLIAVLFIDLNGFKGVNDSYGHNAGDQLLSQVGQSLKSTVRFGSGDIVARYGGDEFSVILINLKNTDDCERVANKIAAVIKQPFDLGLGFDVEISASIGASFYPQDSENLEELISQADFAMYYAKNNGYVYSCWDDTQKKLAELKIAID